MKFEIKNRWNGSIIYSCEPRYLNFVNLHGANLREADLTGADLHGANLTGADLTGADLRGADLTGADLRGADLTGADLRGADLTGADLRGANLTGADLRGAHLTGADLPKYQITPFEGDFIAFKKISSGVIKLKITGRRTSSLIGRKCRCSECVMVEGEAGVDNYSQTIKYEIGKTIVPDAYNPDIRVECTKGIHFFMTREEAEKY